MTLVSGIPLPNPLHAWLPADGVNNATWHEYVATVEVHSDRPGQRAFEFQFRCTATGAIRRWGVAYADDTRNGSNGARA